MRFARSGLTPIKSRCSRSMRTSAALVVALLLLGIGHGAMADDFTSGFYTRGINGVVLLEEGRGQGPVYLPLPRRWALIPRFSISPSASYEYNLTQDAESRRFSGGISLVPGLMLVYGQRNQNHMYLDLGLIVPSIRTGGASKTVGYLVNAGAVVRMGRTRVAGRLGYRQTEDLDALAGARLVRRDYTISLSGERRLSRTFSLGLSGGANRHEYNDPNYSSYWRYYFASRVLFHFDARRRNDYYIQTGAGHDRMDDKDTSSSDTSFRDISIGVRSRPTGKTTVNGSIGYRWRTSRDSGKNSYIAAIRVDTRPMGVTTFRGEWRANVNPAVSTAGFNTVDQRVTLSARRRIMIDRLRGNASVFAGQIDYTGPSDLADENGAQTSAVIYDGRRDEYWGYRLGLDLAVPYNFSFGAYYSFFENRGARNGPAEVQALSSYDSGRWGLRASWNY